MSHRAVTRRLPCMLLHFHANANPGEIDIGWRICTSTRAYVKALLCGMEFCEVYEIHLGTDAVFLAWTAMGMHCVGDAGLPLDVRQLDFWVAGTRVMYVWRSLGTKLWT